MGLVSEDSEEARELSLLRLGLVFTLSDSMQEAGARSRILS
jgi:hypothetical protein